MNIASTLSPDVLLTFLACGILGPDAKTVAYTYRDPKVTPPRGVALVPLEGETKVTILDIPAQCVRWTADSGSLLYSTDQGVYRTSGSSQSLAEQQSSSPTLQVRRSPFSMYQKTASNWRYNASPPVLMWY